MRRVDEPVEPLAPGEPPRAFRWRGRRYVVRSVLTHWVETGAWWTTEALSEPAPGRVADGTPDEVPDGVPDAERELWRVEAGARGAAAAGVLDLCLEPGRLDSGRLESGPGRGSGWSVRHVYD